MRRIEKEEERLSFTEPDKQCFHLCIVNLGQCFLDNTISHSCTTSLFFIPFYLLYHSFALSWFILLLWFSSLFSYSNFAQYCYCPRLLFLSSTLPSCRLTLLTRWLIASFLPLILSSFLPHILFPTYSPSFSSLLLLLPPFLSSSLLTCLHLHTTAFIQITPQW